MRVGRVVIKIVHSVQNAFSKWTIFSFKINQFKRFVQVSMLSMVFYLIEKLYYLHIIYIIKRDGQLDKWTINNIALKIRRKLMHLKVKQPLMAPALYILHLNANNIAVQEHYLLMNELLAGRALYDLVPLQYNDGEYLVIFYDELTISNPKVINAFLGDLEFKGYSFDTSQEYAYKFTPKSEVVVFPRKNDLINMNPRNLVMWFKFKNHKIIVPPNSQNNISTSETAGPEA